MIFELKEKKDKILEKMYDKAMNELNNFFGISWKKNKPNLIILNSRKDIDNIRNEKSPDWLIGWADSQDIYMLNFKKYKTESSHKKDTIDDYYKTLKHELCHMFFSSFSQRIEFHQYIWLSEGVSIFVANQVKNKIIKFRTFIDQYSKFDGLAYQESGFAIQVLVENFGKQRLLDLIKSLKEVKSEKDFNKQFKKIYGQNPTYKFFNRLLTEHSQNAKRKTQNKK